MRWWVSGLVLCAFGTLAACGKVEQAPGSSGKTLCFDYYQRCVNPVFNNVQMFGAVHVATSNCSDLGCHQVGVGRGGALKLHPIADAPIIDLSMTTPDQARTTPMYANFLSAKGSSNRSNPRQSFLIKKPLVEVFHGGARIFPNDTARGVQEFEFWISNSVDENDEFGAQCAMLFNPPLSTTCQF